MVRTWTKNLILTAAGCTVVFLFVMTSKGTSQTAGLTTREVINRFNEAFNRQDADALEAMFTDDTVFENTSPAPDGQRIAGRPPSSRIGGAGLSAIPMRVSTRRR